MMTCESVLPLSNASLASNCFKTWLEVKEKLAIEIKQIVEKNNAAFAFPSQSIYIEKK